MQARTWKRVLAMGGAAAVVPVVFTVSSALTAAPGPASVVVPVAPERVLDTRNGIGTNGSTAAVGADATITLHLGGVGSVPGGATGVVLNLTGTQATAATYITAFPTGTPRSTTSVLNVGPGSDIANTITVALGTGGALDLYNFTGSVHLVADVTGYLVDAASVIVPPVTTPTTPPPTTGAVSVGAYGGRIMAGTPLAFHYGCARMTAGGEIWYDLPLPDGAVVTSLDIQHYDAAAGQAVRVELFTSSWADPAAPTSVELAQVDLPDTGALFVTTSASATPSPALQLPDRSYLVVGFGNSVQLLYCGAVVHYTLA